MVHWRLGPSQLNGTFTRYCMQCGRFSTSHQPDVTFTCEELPQMFSHYISAKEDGWRMSLLQRGIQIWSNVVKIIRYWLALFVSKRPRNNKSFDTLVKYHSDHLMICKFQFFKYVASVLKYFLVGFQTNKQANASFLSNCSRKVVSEMSNVIYGKRCSSWMPY